MVLHEGDVRAREAHRSAPRPLSGSPVTAGRGIVTMAETWWLNHHKPPVGGTPAGGIPTIAEGPSASPTAPPKMVLDHLAKPADVAPDRCEPASA